MGERNDTILVVSDLHAPYMHIDAVAFLGAVKKKYRPTRVIFTGDEADKHALSFHEHDPDLPASGDELDRAIVQLSPLYALFPRVDILESNHGSLAVRRAVAHGLSRKYLRSYGDVLTAPATWRWHEWVRIDVGGRRIIFSHGLSANVLNAVKSVGACYVQGHHHTKFDIQYLGFFNGHTQWGMTVGCLIDDAALSFRYNKLQLARPLLGVGLIMGGHPRLIEMSLNANCRWTGEIA